MNGEANGTIEEPMDVSPISLDREPVVESVASEKKLIKEICVTTEIDYLDSEHSHSNDEVKNSSANVELHNGLVHQSSTDEGSDESKLSNGNPSSPNSSSESNNTETTSRDQNTEEITDDSNEETDDKSKDDEILDSESKHEDSNNSTHLSDDKESQKTVELMDDIIIEDASDDESQIAEAVSINSDSDDSSQDNNEHSKSNDIIILDNESPQLTLHNSSQDNNERSKSNAIIILDNESPQLTLPNSSQDNNGHSKSNAIFILDNRSPQLTRHNSSQDNNVQSKSNAIFILDNRSPQLTRHNSSQDNNGQSKSNAIFILDNESPNSSEVHEIESENDCVVAEETNNVSSKEKKKIEPRRSARTPSKRVKYDEDYDNETESDVELVQEDPVKRKSRPIIIKDAKKLVNMAAKQEKNQKKETKVIIDSPTKKNNKSSTLNANLYQSIVARGTTVTPVKVNTVTQVSQVTNSPIPSTVSQPQSQPQPNILPSLTDDMFVVEAPSFIVPYVYEKPALKPFREFVDKLGKELEDQKEKEEKEAQEKKREEKAKRQQERKEKRERGEEVQSSEDEVDNTAPGSDLDALDAKKKKAEKKERRRRKKEDDDASWDGSESEMSDDDETISDEEAVEVLKEKADTFEDIKTALDLSLTQSNVKSDNYFDCSLGKFFTNIGINLVKEYVQTDLIKQQSRKLYREKKTGHSTKEREVTIAALMKNLELSKENNEPYKYTLKKCKFCSFKTESDLVMENHLQTPHMKNNLYKCNFCPYEIKNIRDIIFHMETVHHVKARLERAASYHQCPNCPFEDNGKGKLGRHLIACAKKFRPEQNQAPPLEWEPPAKIPKLAKGRNSIGGSCSSSFVRPNSEKQMSMGGVVVYSSGGRQRGKPVPTIQPRGLPISGTQIIRSGLGTRQPAPIPTVFAKGKSVQHPSISITPLPRQPTPISIQPIIPPPNTKNSTFVICEICDGYIKDLEQLRNHMQWIHKVKIHPKMIYNRPPLNCQKCQFRFFTDQGLERHLLGSHGLVTSSMQEAANKGKDAGRCPVCGRVYQWKLLNHVARDHSLTLKPAHLSYKCTVCTATFGMYKQFENHVYSAHSVVAKRVMDKNKPATPPAKTAEAAAKALKINDEITITPQPASAPTKNK